MSIEKNIEQIAETLGKILTLLDEPVTLQTTNTVVDTVVVDTEVEAPENDLDKKQTKKRANKKTTKKEEKAVENKKEPKYDEDSIRTVAKKVHAKLGRVKGQEAIHKILIDNGAANHKVFELKPEVYGKVCLALEDVLVGVHEQR